MERLNWDGGYRGLYANIETAQTTREDVARGMAAICSVLGRSARLYLDDTRLADKLREPRVRRVIEPMLAGTGLGTVPEDDRQYLVDLGLLRRDGAGGLIVANPIYREVLPRALAGGPQDSLPRISPTWLSADGELDPRRLLDAFLAFWRRHGEAIDRGIGAARWLSGRAGSGQRLAGDLRPACRSTSHR
jgi:hypothetical protein